MKLLLSLMIVSFNVQADELRDIACKYLANAAVMGFEYKGKFQSQEQFFTSIEVLTPHKRKVVELGYLAADQEQAFNDGMSYCINIKQE